MRKHTQIILAVLMVLLVAVESQSQEAAKGVVAKTTERHFLMWKASSQTASVYLAGSLHLGTKDLYPLPDAVEAAFAGSKILAIEVNIKTVDPAKAVTFMRDHGMYGAGDSLSKHLSKDNSDALDSFCTKYGFPRQMFEPMKPWAAGLLAAALPLQKEGASPEFGIDMHFLNEAKPPQSIDELETVDLQLSVRSSGTEQDQMEFLASALKTNATWEGLLEAYSEGKIGVTLPKGGEPMPFLKKLVDDRNDALARHVEEYLGNNGQYFVLLGAAHITGDKGVVKILQDRGYRVEQVTLDWK